MTIDVLDVVPFTSDLAYPEIVNGFNTCCSDLIEVMTADNVDAYLYSIFQYAVIGQYEALNSFGLPVEGLIFGFVSMSGGQYSYWLYTGDDCEADDGQIPPMYPNLILALCSAEAYYTNGIVYEY